MHTADWTTHCGGVTPDALREDSYLRAETKRQVDEVKKIIDNLPGLGF